MILVTGATGKIGGEVARLLAASGTPVRAFVRSPRKAAGLAGLGVELAPGDLADTGSLAVAMDGIERLFLVCAQDLRQAELQGNAVTAAAAAGVRHVVKVSGIGPSLSLGGPAEVGRQHWQTEQQIERSGMAFTFLRPNFFMQNLLETAAPMVSKLSVLAAPMDNAPIAMVDARDVAAAGAAALTSDAHYDRVYDVTGPRAFTYRQLAGVLSNATHRTISYVNPPPALAARVLRRQGYEDWYVEHLAAMTALFRAGAGATVSTAVADVTGRQPRSIEDFTTEFASQFSQNPAPPPVQTAARLGLGLASRTAATASRLAGLRRSR
ncbi:MAG TPA: SDR family oxidoreductase [Streptosporangiaceae bacterium]|nr:SDR family oxidoreductase [Streptosporangiaceae bacterium]